MSDPVSIAKDALAEVKTAVVPTPGMLESLIAKVEAAFVHFEAEAAFAAGLGAVAVAPVVNDAAEAVEPPPTTPAEPEPAEPEPADKVVDDEPAAVKDVANG